MCEHTLSFEEIKAIVNEDWPQFVIEAEEIYAKENNEAKDRFQKIAEFAQLKVVHQLIEFKGEWLSVLELQYALDLVNPLCASLKNCKRLKHKGTSILDECRSRIESETSAGYVLNRAAFHA